MIKTISRFYTYIFCLQLNSRNDFVLLFFKNVIILGILCRYIRYYIVSRVKNTVRNCFEKITTFSKHVSFIDR